MYKKNQTRERIAIYCQEIFNDISIFTNQTKTRFYDELFLNLELSSLENQKNTGRKPTSKQSLICAFIVMKCEGFSQITNSVDYLNNNLIIEYFCGFNIFKPLPSYWTFERFIKNLDNSILKSLMES